MTNIQWYTLTPTGKQAIAAPRGTAANLVVTTEGVYGYKSKDAAGCDVTLCCPVRVVAVPPIVVNTQPTGLTECIGGTQNIKIGLFNDGRTVAVQWQTSSDSLTWIDINGATDTLFTPPSQTEGKIFYRAQVSVVGFSCSATYSAGVAVQVVTKPSSWVTANNTIVCPDGRAILNVVVSDATKTCTIQWQSSTNAGQTWSDINGANQTRYETHNLSSSTHFRANLICGASGCCL